MLCVAILHDLRFGAFALSKQAYKRRLGWLTMETVFGLCFSVGYAEGDRFMKRIAVLGSTGSIGVQTLDVVRRHPDKLNVVALAAGRRAAETFAQAGEFGVTHVALGFEPNPHDIPEGVEVRWGADAVEDLVRLPEVDLGVNALVGAAGLRRHGAIYQCLIGESPQEVSCLWVTASGGPFRGRTRDELRDITPAQALAHPTWNMGPKITIDSSTLMNKGLEVIEAHHLFAMPYDRIRVVVQPQSAIHSMVEFSDGSVKAHLGTTDMRIPIQYALSYPERWDAPVEPLDFTKLGSLEFAAPDLDTFRCLALARAAGEEGGTLPCVMNAANEIAVAAFLAGEGSYLGIAECVEAVMDAHTVEKVESVDQLLEIDAWAREAARERIR